MPKKQGHHPGITRENRWRFKNRGLELGKEPVDSATCNGDQSSGSLRVEDGYLNGDEDGSVRGVSTKSADAHPNLSGLLKVTASRVDAAVLSPALKETASSISYTGSIEALVQESRAKIAAMIGIEPGRVKLHVEFWSR